MLMVTLGAFVWGTSFAVLGFLAGRSGLRNMNPASAIERRSDSTNG